MKAEVGGEDYNHAHFILGKKDRALIVRDALRAGDCETVGKKMHETHGGLSRDYEISYEEFDFLSDIAKESGATGSHITGDDFGGYTINSVRDEIHDRLVADITEKYPAKFGEKPEVYDVVINQGSHGVY